MTAPETTRLNKYISDSGYCSRREADKLIESGKVTINGQVAALGTKVSELDEVKVKGHLIRSSNAPIYLAFHKPIGITCTTDRSVKGNIIDYIKHEQRIFPIGRLDKPSEGLIFLTNDGDIVNKILRAGNKHEKEYIVWVNKPIDADFIHKMSNGLPILDRITLNCEVEQLEKKQFRIVLTQGLNRQIRRMCEYLGYEVLRLKRVRIMNVQLDGLKAGQWRYLSETELSNINAQVANSVTTPAAEQMIYDELD